MSSNELGNSIINYIQSVAKDYLGQLSEYVRIEHNESLMKVRVTYNLGMDIGKKISIEPYCIIYYKDVRIYGNLGFYLSYDEEEYNKNKDVSLSYFKIVEDKILKELDFRYIYSAKTTMNNETNSIYFGYDLNTILEQFFADFSLNLKNGTYEEIFRLFNKCDKFVRKDYIVGFVCNLLSGTDTFDKSIDYWKRGRIINIKHLLYDGMEGLIGTALGHDEHIYKVSAIFDEKGLISHECECLAHKTYPGICKHVGALLLTYAKNDKR